MLERVTPFALSGLLAGVFSVAFGLFVLFKSRDKKLRRVWFLFTMAAAGWGFGGFWIGTTQAPHSPRLAFIAAYCLGVVWIAPLFYHFVHIFIKRSSPLIWIQYAVASAFCALVPTKIFFTDAVCIVGSFQGSIGGRIYPAFFAWWIGTILLSHWVLIRAYKTVSVGERRQIAYFFLATAIGFTGGSLCYFPSFNVPIYPWGNFTVFLYPIIMSYAMLKYQLMDVRFFLRRAALLIGVYVGLLLVGIPLMLLLHSIAVTPTLISKSWLSVEVLLLSTLLSCGPFLYAYVVRTRSFFKEHAMAGITHELKSPLATMENALDIFAKRIANKMDRGDMEYLAMLKNNQRRLSNSVNDLLCVYKVDGNSSLVMSEFDLAELLTTVSEGFESMLRLKNVSVRTVFSSTPIPIRGDRDKITQIVSNLLSNAIKFSESGSITISVESHGRELHVSVKDCGAGIPHAELPYVFDRFYQGKLKPTTQGSGIGLTIAKAWVEAHGGKIWAESDGEGKGATVTFTLPL